MKKLITTSILFLFTGVLSFAQEIEKKCGTNEHMNEIFVMYPELRSHYELQQLLDNSRVNQAGSEAKSNHLYEIPVVFHILHEYGSENISDAQVYDALEVMNREYNSADPDSVDVVSEFQNLIGNAKIQFKLAAKDPFGNCTNGIEHIYSHETRIGDAFSKVDQWNRSKYLNIWVVKVVGVGGAAAYAVKPAGTDGSYFWLDGIVSNHTYVGSIGTSSPFTESTLSHEIGHYLNLSHTWGDTNDPGVACGDDGVSDTPVTAGWTSCPLGNADFCNAGIQEDLQNYMEYAYCDRHFTPGQVVFMHNALEGIAGQRNNLWKEETLIETGVKDLVLPQDPANTLSVPMCAPVADFNSDDKTVCVGSFVNFEDASWNAVIENREWTFTGGNPATSTSANPVVSWDTPGWKNVSLRVSNAAGEDIRTENSYIYVSPDWADYDQPLNMNMETNGNWFIVQNPENNYGKFKLISDYGYNGSKCYKLENYKDISNADPYTADYFYNNRLGLSVDNLITPSIELLYTTGITVKFKYAYATNATLPADITEELKVYSSRDCGASWTTRKTINGTDLVTGGFAGNQDYKPTTNGEWQEASFTYTATSQDKYTRFKFEFTASDLSSNLYIDDIEIIGVLGTNDLTLADLELVVYPNPTNGEAINVSFVAQNEPTTFTLRDVQGKVIATQVVETTNGMVNTSLNNTANLPAACYFLEVSTGGHSLTKKVVVL